MSSDPLIAYFSFRARGNAHALQGEGWAAPEDEFCWMVGTDSELLLPPLPADDDLIIEIDAIPHLRGPTLNQQRLGLSLDGQRFGDAVLTEVGVLSFRLDRRLIAAGRPQRLGLHHPDARRPNELSNSPDRRSLAIAVRSLQFSRAAPADAAAQANGDARRRLFALGHSHLDGWMRTVRSEPTPGWHCEAFQFLRREQHHKTTIDGQAQYLPTLVADARQQLDAFKPDVVLFLLEGEQSALSGLMPAEEAYALYAPGSAPVGGEEDRPVMPYDLMLEWQQQLYGAIDRFMSQIAVPPGVHRIAIAPPPPAHDAAYVLNNLNGHAIADVLLGRGLPPARWREQVWRASVHALRLVYERHGVHFIGAPESTLHAEGCLQPAYSADAFHASPAYYRLVLRQLAAELERLDAVR